MPTPSVGTTRHTTPQRHHVSRLLNNNKKLLDQSQGVGVKSKIPTAELENRFSKLTHLLYDTNVKFKDLNEHVYPLIHEDITFTDPWQTITGKSQFVAQLKGFHSAIFFTYDTLQLSVQVNENEESGRVIVDGWMYLNQVKYITGTIPLRTVLVYDFVFNGDGDTFLITDLEEMWSLGDLIEKIPIIGWFYNLFRFGAGFFFTIFFLICTFIALRLPFSNVSGQPSGKNTSSGGKKSSICSSLNPLNFAK
ncbi:predicted protein [Naegleria gruberi]|uniref:Predicted protein n=1 Tax=Naegleria gruberi TaxID=5762 RepID=D2VJQ0_NAEGR|nr:uncharacterized protein NAEGRDRAFT_69119 [Naegleria gruberi]EFC42991.1 predicted protein [Naegleria gruberi]|eukprot:XP_002675735.1 predicted protein [Naegleria gruberi strain NEG-M]